MKHALIIFEDEKGFVLVLAMIIMLILTVMGISITRMSTIELQIAGNDRRVKHAFYKADGGTEVAIELLEENFSCPVGFNKPAGFDSDDATTSSYLQIVGVDLFDANFSKDKNMSGLAVDSTKPAPVTSADVPTDSYRTLRIPDDPSKHDDIESHTNVAIYGTTDFAEGSALQMSSAYHGMGFSVAGGGGIKNMDVLAQYDGVVNSIAKIFLEYVHLIGLEGECNY
ncbi:MAG: hypothetical protein COA36_04825 [Desulfotalea sp.]|nr:MAG: hypothetical protein COA36_04825 [Desulfotalea sp.]